MKLLIPAVLWGLEVSSASLPFSPDLKQIFVSGHNTRRTLLANGGVSGYPQAANMANVEWDDTAASFAATHANKCIYQHSSNSERNFGGVQHGENLYATASSVAINPDTAMNSSMTNWWDEHSDWNHGGDMTFTGNKCTPGKQCGHFTQMAWATTVKIGCAVNMDCTPSQMGWTDFTGNAAYIVCIYAPAG